MLIFRSAVWLINTGTHTHMHSQSHLYRERKRERTLGRMREGELCFALPTDKNLKKVPHYSCSLLLLLHLWSAFYGHFIHNSKASRWFPVMHFLLFLSVLWHDTTLKPKKDRNAQCLGSPPKVAAWCKCWCVWNFASLPTCPDVKIAADSESMSCSAAYIYIYGGAKRTPRLSLSSVKQKIIASILYVWRTKDCNIFLNDIDWQFIVEFSLVNS